MEDDFVVCQRALLHHGAVHEEAGGTKHGNWTTLLAALGYVIADVAADGLTIQYVRWPRGVPCRQPCTPGPLEARVCEVSVLGFCSFTCHRLVVRVDVDARAVVIGVVGIATDGSIVHIWTCNPRLDSPRLGTGTG